MKRRILAAAVLVAALQTAGIAQAQQAQTPGQQGTVSMPLQPSDLREYEDFVVPRLGVAIDRLEDMDIVGPNGEEIGEVEEILVDGQGRVVAVAAEIGGFLGIGEREVVIGIDQFTVQGDRDALAIAMTREQLEALPQWNN